MNSRPVVINIIGGPGSGKSTIATHVFSNLKLDGVDIELVTEYAKDKVWEGSLNVLENQIYVFGKQQHRLYRVAQHVDVVITDSPLFLSPVYDKTNSFHFKNLVLEEINKYNNINIFLERSREVNYTQKGRYQTEEEALNIDNRIKNFLDENNIDYNSVVTNKRNLNTIRNIIYDKLGFSKKDVIYFRKC